MALVGVAVNLIATVVLAGADRSSRNVESAFQHILTDLASFVATAIAGAVILLTGFERADGIAALLVAAPMLRAAFNLLRESGRVFLEAAPRGLDPQGCAWRACPGSPRSTTCTSERSPRASRRCRRTCSSAATPTVTTRAARSKRLLHDEFENRPHDAAGRPRGRRPAGDRGQPAGITQPAIATKWTRAAATTSAWKISWKPKVCGHGSGQRIA